jgi:hypothetical protein
MHDIHPKTNPNRKGKKNEAYIREKLENNVNKSHPKPTHGKAK